VHVFINKIPNKSICKNPNNSKKSQSCQWHMSSICSSHEESSLHAKYAGTHALTSKSVAEKHDEGTLAWHAWTSRHRVWHGWPLYSDATPPLVSRRFFHLWWSWMRTSKKTLLSSSDEFVSSMMYPWNNCITGDTLYDICIGKRKNTHKYVIS
jgi:hypothetical protein